MLSGCIDVWRRVVDEVVLMSKGWSELDRRERPIVPKTFILLTVIETILVVVGAIYTLAEEPGDRYGRFLWMLTVVGAGFLLYFGCDAVFKENLILLIVFNIGCAIITARLWFIFVSEFMTDGYAHEITEGAILGGVTICQLSYLLLSKTMSDDFGRHVFITVGAKLHIVNLYKIFQYWLGSLKADFQVTSMVLIIAIFYFDISYPLQITLGVYMLCLLGVYIATVRWVELENSHFLMGFMVFSLVQPVLSIVGVVRLNSSHETLRHDVTQHIQIIDGENETTTNTSGTEGLTSALILINTTVGLCSVVRCVMLWALYRTIRGFGKGLTEALHKTETCAVLRSDTDDWGLIDRATGFETYHQDGTSSRRTPTPPPCQPVSSTYPEEDTPLEKLKLDDKKLTNVYGVTKTDAKFTCYCHHFSDDGKHCVTNGLGPDMSKKCNGVMYASAAGAIGNFFGVSALSLQCGKQRGTHRPCQKDNCPYVAAGKDCPYSVKE